MMGRWTYATLLSPCQSVVEVEKRRRLRRIEDACTTDEAGICVDKRLIEFIINLLCIGEDLLESERELRSMHGCFAAPLVHLVPTAPVDECTHHSYTVSSTFNHSVRAFSRSLYGRLHLLHEPAAGIERVHGQSARKLQNKRGEKHQVRTVLSPHRPPALPLFTIVFLFGPEYLR